MFDILTIIPGKKKLTQSGWTSFNAPCCHHRGHKQDTRKRAGIRFDGNGIVYNCFNCKFSTGWQPGSPFGEKMKTLTRWLGAGEDTIKELVFESLKTESDQTKTTVQEQYIEFADKELPEGALPLIEWLDADLNAEEEQKLVAVIEYVVGRGYDPLGKDFYWSPVPGYADRVIIPFRWQNRIVGNTARKVNDGKPKYLSDQHPHFVFNFDKQNNNQKYILVVEGPFDALSINGVALLTNDIAEQQARIINSLGAEVIVIPDQDKAGLVLFDRAIELDWSVAMPNWDPDIKDCADAVNRYGKLFVVMDAIMTAEKGAIRVGMAKKRQEHKLEKIEYEEDH